MLRTDLQKWVHVVSLQRATTLFQIINKCKLKISRSIHCCLSGKASNWYKFNQHFDLLGQIEAVEKEPGNQVDRPLICETTKLWVGQLGNRLYMLQIDTLKLTNNWNALQQTASLWWAHATSSNFFIMICYFLCSVMSTSLLFEESLPPCDILNWPFIKSLKTCRDKIFKVYEERIQALYKQLPIDIRTVPTFVSVLMFCASRKACFNRHLRTRNDIDIHL